jgi:hypothetical protein
VTGNKKSNPLVNHLFFRSNTTGILAFLKTKASADNGQGLFSLNSIRQLPASLTLPPSADILGLSLMNVDLPLFDERIAAGFLTYLPPEYKGKQPHEEILATAGAVRNSLPTAKNGNIRLEIFDRAMDNFITHGFFCRYDWCLNHWGTAEDIQTVTRSTFHPATTCIEFTTLDTPPLMGLQYLADTFPSVIFTLHYRLLSAKKWQEVQLFPLTPFGY